jgi:hypothetical protein
LDKAQNRIELFPDPEGINPRVRQEFQPLANGVHPTFERLTHAFYSACPDAAVFQYSTLNTSPNYSPACDVNLEMDLEVTTAATIPPSVSALASAADTVHQLLSALPTLSLHEIAAVEEVTRLQCESPMWKEQRVGRITGSIAHSVVVATRKLRLGTVTTESPSVVNVSDTILGIKTLNPDIKALKHGRTMEPIARRAYCIEMRKHHRNIAVRQSGLVISQSHFYVAASPDGIVKCACCPEEGILEIKAPLSLHQKNEAPSANNSPHFDADGKLKHSSPYYTQVQMQLGVTQAKWCDSFVFTRQGHSLERIHFDADVWQSILTSAEFFFENVIAARLTGSTTILW